MAKLSFVVLTVTLFLSAATKAITVGGWQEGTKDSEEVARLAALAVKDIETASNSMYRSHLVDIIRVETQVGGAIYYFLDGDERGGIKMFTFQRGSAWFEDSLLRSKSLG